MSDYTPTTEEVRDGWVEVQNAWWPGCPDNWDDLKAAEFDRWLAEVKAQERKAERERIIKLLEKINLDDRFRDYWFGIYGDDFKEQSGFVTLIALIKGEEQ